MASPQKENGYTAIANEILEALAKSKLNGTQRAIIDVVFRYTYGFSRKSHEFSISFLLQALGMTKVQNKQVRRELETLIETKVLIEVKSPTKNSSRILAFNKNYSEWTKKTSGLIRPLDKLDHSERTKKTTQPVVELDHQERKIKENNKESISVIFDYYISLDLKKHKTFTKAMKDSINKAMKENKYSIEDCKTLLLRHDKVVKATKNLEYPITIRGLDEFFGQKVFKATHLICSEYEEGGKYYDKYKHLFVIQENKKIEPFKFKIIEMEAKHGPYTGN
jgi:phage replication O-like protein O